MRNAGIKIILFFLIGVLFFSLSINSVFAVDPAAPAVGAADDMGPPAPPTDPQVVSLQNPLKGDVKDVAVLIGMIIKAALSVVGALSLGVFVVGGFTWLTSAGNQEKVSKGSKTMLWATIGLIVVFASYAAVALLFTF